MVVNKLFMLIRNSTHSVIIYSVCIIIITLLLFLLLLKLGAHAQVGKSNLFINYFRNPTNKLREATNDSLLP